MRKEEIVQGLRSLGVGMGMELEVHSSLRSFGHVEGGAETVIEALMDCVGDRGGIFMPALRLSPPMALTQGDREMGVAVKLKVLPEDAERTGMGIVADTFRRRPDVVTGEGVIRTSGWGRNAGRAAESGLEHLIHNGGKGLLMGVDIYKLTAMHYVEDILPKAIEDIFAPGETARERYPADEWFIEAGAPPVKPWYTIQDMAYQRGVIKDGYIGCCKCMFFDIWDVVGLYRAELEQDPLRLYGLG